MNKHPGAFDQPCAPLGPSTGYCRPPQDHQFKPGQSGNPRGRPRGSKNKSLNVDPNWLSEILLQEAHRTVSIEDPGGQIEISVTEAVVRSLGLNAQKGDLRAQKVFLGLIESHGRESKRER